MSPVPDADGRQPGAVGFLDEDVGGQPTDDLAVGQSTVDDGRGLVLPEDHRCLVRDERVVGDHVPVGRNPKHAVGGVALEVGVDERGRDHLRHVVRCAEVGEQSGRERPQLRWLYGRHSPERRRPVQ